MSSTIFYRFRSQKENSRVPFDGTGLTVFDLKKEIISLNKLEPATDFNLAIYNPDNNEEYVNDNTVIPRSSFVIARRYPALKYQNSNASRYIEGKPRMTTSSGSANAMSSGVSKSQASAAASMITLGNDSGVSEEDKIKAMFQNQDMAWQETQEHMRNATFVTKTSTDPPPPGYICYRCGSKDHFIKDCPTNGDNFFDGKRIKRTVGIPKSSLKTVEKPEEDGNYMMGDDGKFVIAVADKRAWESYQKKQNMMNNLNEEKIADKSLIDPITKRVFVKPVKTPCCEKTYSYDTIENMLIENDFVCPNCKKPDILLDQLKQDEEMIMKLNELEKAAEKNELKRSSEDDESNLDQQSKKLRMNNALPMSLPMMPQPGSMMAPPFIPGFPGAIMPAGMPFIAQGPGPSSKPEGEQPDELAPDINLSG